MTEQAAQHHPTEIKLHAKSRLLHIGFDDGSVFELPCEYLRVFSRAAEVRTSDRPIVGKEGVNILSIEPQGQYAVRLVFDDGHDTGIYSWDTLYALGRDMERNWAEYLGRLEAIGYRRQEPDQGDKRVRLLYFSWLAQKLRKESEQAVVPAAVPDVEGLLRWLGQRRKGAARAVRPGTGTSDREQAVRGAFHPAARWGRDRLGAYLADGAGHAGSGLECRRGSRPNRSGLQRQTPGRFASPAPLGAGLSPGRSRVAATRSRPVGTTRPARPCGLEGPPGRGSGPGWSRSWPSAAARWAGSQRYSRCSAG